MRSLGMTQIIENPNGAVRRVIHRVSYYRDAEMALRWTATGFVEAEQSVHRIHGVKDLWLLATVQGRKCARIDTTVQAA